MLDVKLISRICSWLLLVALSWSLVSCGNNLETIDTSATEQSSVPPQEEKLTEVAPPILIEQLRQSLEQYQPQVTILSPKMDEILPSTTVNVQVQVGDLPIFQNPELKLGPHLHLIVDNETYGAVYDVDKPIVLTDLTPGTHTLRLFASRPWHESFKNEGAYAQTTFHVLTKTNENNPDPSLPLLTYSRPKGTYGAEPIMLDFYLTNAPLHLVAPEEIADWRIRVTANGQSFLLDTWQPIYLQGFKPGKNWVQLEFIDGAGNNIPNVFNNTARLITYEPNGQDSLAKIVRGEVELEAVRGIVDQNYQVPSSPPITDQEEIPGVEAETTVVEPTEEATFTDEPTVEEIPVEKEIPVEEEVTVEEPIVEEEVTVEENSQSIFEFFNPFGKVESIEEEASKVEEVPVTEEPSAVEPVVGEEVTVPEEEETPVVESIEEEVTLEEDEVPVAEEEETPVVESMEEENTVEEDEVPVVEEEEIPVVESIE